MTEREKKSRFASKVAILTAFFLVSFSFLGSQEARGGAGSQGGRLNNLVTELINRTSLPARDYQEISFTNPRKGWIFVSSTAAIEAKGRGKITISLDKGKEDPVIIQRAKGISTEETMRFLPAGEHKLRIWSKARTGKLPSLKKLIVRAVPAMMLCAYGDPSLAGYGVYDFKFLEKDVLPNINVIVGSSKKEYRDAHKQWQERGGKWYLEQNVPTLLGIDLPDMPRPLTADYVYDYWTQSPGFTNPYLDGVLADEFFARKNDPDYHGYSEAIRRISRNEEFKDKAIHAWCAGNMYEKPLPRSFARTVIDAGYKIAWEVYLAERPTEKEARELLYSNIRQKMKGWEKTYPGFPRDLIFVLGILCAQPESVNVNPEVDFKVFLDMQYNYLANAPEYAGLYGIMVYKARYADEESLRWSGRLFRHYCIEGNRDLLSERYGYKYRPGHLQNADFVQGLKAWQVSPAGKGAIKTSETKGMGHLLGRYAMPGAGDTYLLMKRSADKPNKISQRIMNLEPGRLYSMKLIVADHQDLVQGRSEKESLGLSLEIDNVEIIPGKSFVSDIHCIYRIGPFKEKDPPWINHHRIVFRAKEGGANLTLSDWVGKKPGGPAGQELLVHFAEIQPYFD